MWGDLTSFFWLFVFCTAGFAITLQALFSQFTQNNAFDTNALTAFTLFPAASNSFDLVGTFDALKLACWEYGFSFAMCCSQPLCF
jgi:hypothetical protein